MASVVPVIVIAAAVGLAFGLMIRGIHFEGVNSDPQKQVQAAARAGEWAWITDMHKHVAQKARMKDVAVLMLVAMQRVLGDRQSFYPVAMVCMLTHVVSAVLVWLIGTEYWSAEVGWLLFALYLTATWAYQLCLQGGYQVIGQMFFLAAVYMMQLAGTGASAYAWYAASGFAIALMLFSSASARKYLPLACAAFLVSQSHALELPELDAWRWIVRTPRFVMGPHVWAGSLVVGLVIMRLTYRRAVAAIYRRMPSWLHRLSAPGKPQPLERYLERADGITKSVTVLGAAVAIYLVAIGFVARSMSFYVLHAAVLAGFGCAVMLLNSPNLIVNLRNYFGYWHVGKETRFRLYAEYFARVGHPIPPDMRGAGIKWVALLFFRVLPFHTAFSLASLVLLGYVAVDHHLAAPLWSGAAVVLLGASPVLFGELTRGPQIGRSYFPGLLGLLLIMGYAGFTVDNLLSPHGRTMFWWIAAGGTAASAAWNLWLFLDDVWPARMATTRLAQALDRTHITRFYTYRTPFNNAFVNVLLMEHPGRYEVTYINSLTDVREGYVVLPGTSSKAFNMESEMATIRDGDFSADPRLNELLQSRAIRRCAVATFKTFGTSRMWVHESEVTSYRYLILREINDEDRWRGRGWIIDASKLREMTALGY